MIELINNLQKENKELKAELAKYDPFYFCSIAGCEGAALDCWKTCPDSVYNKTKIEAYKEFATKLKLHRRKMASADFSGEFWDYAVLEESIDSTLKELEGKL